MQSSLRLSGPVMATEDGTLGAASLKEEAMQQGRSDFQSIPSTHFNLNPPLHDGIDISATVPAAVKLMKVFLQRFFHKTLLDDHRSLVKLAWRALPVNAEFHSY